MKFTIALAQTLHPENGEELVICELDTDAIARMRQAIPVLDHLRDDVY